MNKISELQKELKNKDLSKEERKEICKKIGKLEWERRKEKSTCRMRSKLRKQLRLQGKSEEEIYDLYPLQGEPITRIKSIKPKKHIGKRFKFNKETKEYEKTQSSHSRDKSIPIVKHRNFPKKFKKREEKTYKGKCKSKRYYAKIRLNNINILNDDIKKLKCKRDLRKIGKLPKYTGSFRTQTKGLKTSFQKNEKQSKYIYIKSVNTGEIIRHRINDDPYNIHVDGAYGYTNRQDYLKSKPKKEDNYVDKRKKIKFDAYKQSKFIHKNKEGEGKKNDSFTIVTKLVKLHYFKNGRYHVKERMKQVRVPVNPFFVNPEVEIQRNEKGEVISRFKKPIPKQKDQQDLKDEWLAKLQREVSKLHNKLLKDKIKAQAKKKIKSPNKRRNIRNNKSHYHPKMVYTSKKSKISDELLDKQEEWRKLRYQKRINRETLRQEKSELLKKKENSSSRSDIIKKKFEEKQIKLKKYQREKMWKSLRDIYAYRKKLQFLARVNQGT